MILPNNTTVAVVDGEKLRLFRNKAQEPGIALVALPDPHVETGNQGSGMRHRSSSANPDQTRLGEDNFAAAVADYLNREILAGGIEKLLLLADPRTLGEMRRRFHDTLTSRLVGDIAKDLTGHSVAAIEAAIQHA